MTSEHEYAKVEHTMAMEEHIRSIPAMLRESHERVAASRDILAPLIDGPLVILGCGTSHSVAQAAASLYEQERHAPAQAILPSDYVPRRDWMHIAISRTGQTTEVVEAMQRVRAAGARCLLLAGAVESHAARYADQVLLLEFAAEEGVIQTRFIAVAFEALRSLILGAAAAAELDDLPARVERGLTAFDAGPLIAYDHVVFLGRGWRHGLAQAAALNLQETTLLVPESHQTLDYRHGPISAADERTLVWSFDAEDDAESASVLADVRKTGAKIYAVSDDPLITLACAQMTALAKARARGIDPSSPRHLVRAVVLER